MIASGLTLTQKPDFIELSARVKFERFPFHTERIWWRFPLEYAEYLHLNGDSLLAALLLPCMFRGERLVIEAPVSEQLLASVPKIQVLFYQWFKEVREIPVTASSMKSITPPGSGLACYFSGGADSFYSLLKNMELPEGDPGQISHLIFINGFDIKFKRKELCQRLRQHLIQTADTVGKTYVETSTNLKAFGDKTVYWRFYYGSVLASISLALGSLFKTVIVPSSYGWHQQHPDGSHPELDVLWSTEKTRFIHDGCEATRVEKIVNQIDKSDLALEHLHVCWRNRNVFFNCGVCEKCLRTMISIYIGTGRTDLPIFSAPLTPEAVHQIAITNESSLMFAQENLAMQEGRHSDFDQRLKAALHRIIDAYSGK